MIGVALVDDQELVRSGFRMIIDSEDDMTVVGEAGDGRDVTRLVRDTTPDLVLMDIEMPHTDGITATEAVLALPDPPKVLIVTTFEKEEYVFRSLAAGASGFLLKSAGAAELVSAVRIVAAGESLLSPSVTRKVISRFAGNDSSDLASEVAEGHGLTDRERDVLALMADGLSNSEIAKSLVVGDATVKTHVSHILEKLGVRDRVQAVVWWYRHS